LPNATDTMAGVDDTRRALLDELYSDGQVLDEAEPDRLRRRRNFEPDSAALLAWVLRATRARTVVEIGTSNGYSAIWLADAVADSGGTVVSVDVERWPGTEANLDRAGVADLVRLRLGDGGDYLAALDDASVDVLFLDAERVEYPRWWPHPKRVLRTGGVLAVDNVLSHPDEVAEFLALVDGDGDFTATTVAVGKGLYLALRAG
jgi:predicted O-methyltransferase YrrM